MAKAYNKMKEKDDESKTILLSSSGLSSSIKKSFSKMFSTSVSFLSNNYAVFLCVLIELLAFISIGYVVMSAEDEITSSSYELDSILKQLNNVDEKDTQQLSELRVEAEDLRQKMRNTVSFISMQVILILSIAFGLMFSMLRGRLFSLVPLFITLIISVFFALITLFTGIISGLLFNYSGSGSYEGSVIGFALTFIIIFYICGFFLLLFSAEVGRKAWLMKVKDVIKRKSILVFGNYTLILIIGIAIFIFTQMSAFDRNLALDENSLLIGLFILMIYIPFGMKYLLKKIYKKSHLV